MKARYSEKFVKFELSNWDPADIVNLAIQTVGSNFRKAIDDLNNLNLNTTNTRLKSVSKYNEDGSNLAVTIIHKRKCLGTKSIVALQSWSGDLIDDECKTETATLNLHGNKVERRLNNEQTFKNLHIRCIVEFLVEYVKDTYPCMLKFFQPDLECLKDYGRELKYRKDTFKYDGPCLFHVVFEQEKDWLGNIHTRIDFFHFEKEAHDDRLSF